jgi:hypothetical protein
MANAHQPHTNRTPTAHHPPVPTAHRLTIRRGGARAPPSHRTPLPVCGVRYAELAAVHAQAYNAGRHAEVIRITAQLNALRGLQPRQPLDRRDDTQRDFDEERIGGWAP